VLREVGVHLPGRVALALAGVLRAIGLQRKPMW
jgi:hypothetical protein